MSNKTNKGDMKLQCATLFDKKFEEFYWRIEGNSDMNDW